MKKFMVWLLALSSMICVCSSLAYATEPEISKNDTIAVDEGIYTTGENEPQSSDNQLVKSILSFSSKKATCTTKIDLTEEGGKFTYIKQTLQKYNTSSGWKEVYYWEKNFLPRIKYTYTNTSTTSLASGKYRLKSEITKVTSTGGKIKQSYYSETVTI